MVLPGKRANPYCSEGIKTLIPRAFSAMPAFASAGAELTGLQDPHRGRRMLADRLIHVQRPGLRTRKLWRFDLPPVNNGYHLLELLGFAPKRLLHRGLV